MHLFLFLCAPRYRIPHNRTRTRFFAFTAFLHCTVSLPVPVFDKSSLSRFAQHSSSHRPFHFPNFIVYTLLICLHSNTLWLVRCTRLIWIVRGCRYRCGSAHPTSVSTCVGTYYSYAKRRNPVHLKLQQILFLVYRTLCFGALVARGNLEDFWRTSNDVTMEGWA